MRFSAPPQGVPLPRADRPLPPARPLLGQTPDLPGGGALRAPPPAPAAREEGVGGGNHGHGGVQASLLFVVFFWGGNVVFESEIKCLKEELQEIKL